MKRKKSTELPPGWEAAVDPSSGKTYYANRSTRETRWDRPSPPRKRCHSASLDTKPAASEKLSSLPSKHSSQKSSKSDQRSSSKSDHHSNPHDSTKQSPDKKSSSPSRQTSERSSKSGQQSNPLYSASIDNEASTDPSKLIAMTRTMLNKSAAFPSQSIRSDLEINSITPGQIADLCQIQRHSTNCGEHAAYTPLNPFRMSTMGVAKLAEGERMDMRLSALNKKLEEFAEQDLVVKKLYKKQKP